MAITFTKEGALIKINNSVTGTVDTHPIDDIRFKADDVNTLRVINRRTNPVLITPISEVSTPVAVDIEDLIDQLSILTNYG